MKLVLMAVLDRNSMGGLFRFDSEERARAFILTGLKDAEACDVDDRRHAG